MPTTLKAGFIALTDCAPLVVAREMGYFKDEGLDVELCRQASWEIAERKIIDGSIHLVHLLATMPLRASLALSDRPAPLCSAWVISRGGNGITASNAVWKARGEGSLSEAIRTGGIPTPLRLGVVHRQAPHEYHLRTWLVQEGIDPDRQAEWVVIPPQEMVGRLRDGRLDIFCAGEPWNQRAASSKLGAIAALGADLMLSTNRTSSGFPEGTPTCLGWRMPRPGSPLWSIGGTRPRVCSKPISPESSSRTSTSRCSADRRFENLS